MPLQNTSVKAKNHHPWLITFTVTFIALYAVVFFAGGDYDSYSMINYYAITFAVIAGILVLFRFFAKKDPQAGVHLLAFSTVTLLATIVTETIGANYYNNYHSRAVMGWAPLLLLISFIAACFAFRSFDPKKNTKARLFLLVEIMFEVLVFLWLMALSMEALI